MDRVFPLPRTPERRAEYQLGLRPTDIFRRVRLPEACVRLEYAKRLILRSMIPKSYPADTSSISVASQLIFHCGLPESPSANLQCAGDALSCRISSWNRVETAASLHCSHRCGGRRMAAAAAAGLNKFGAFAWGKEMPCSSALFAATLPAQAGMKASTMYKKQQCHIIIHPILSRHVSNVCVCPPCLEVLPA